MTTSQSLFNVREVAALLEMSPDATEANDHRLDGRRVGGVQSDPRWAVDPSVCHSRDRIETPPL
jgi:hypothetical protein